MVNMALSYPIFFAISYNRLEDKSHKEKLGLQLVAFSNLLTIWNILDWHIVKHIVLKYNGIPGFIAG